MCIHSLIVKSCKFHSAFLSACFLFPCGLVLSINIWIFLPCDFDHCLFYGLQFWINPNKIAFGSSTSDSEGAHHNVYLRVIFLVLTNLSFFHISILVLITLK